jgi:hypothetical protein
MTEQPAGSVDAAPAGCAPPGVPASIREFEQAMRQMGFSRAQARAIALYGYKAGAAPGVDEAADGEAELLRALDQLKVAFAGAPASTQPQGGYGASDP